MENFNIPVTRTSHRSTVIQVSANTLEEAEQKAIEMAGDIEFPGEQDAEYSITNKISDDKLKKAKSIAAGHFLADLTDLDNLEQMVADGRGDDIPDNDEALVCEQYENETASWLVTQIDQLANEIARNL